MTQETWAAIDAYFADQLLQPDEALDAALRDSAAAGLPAINVSPLHGKLLHLIAKLKGAQSVLEIGTLGGYSTIWLARALPANGRLVSLEIDPARAELARKNIARANVAASVQVRVGRAADTLTAMVAAGEGPFDLVFIDADKRSTLTYYERALELTRPGSILIVDNVVRRGNVTDAATTDADIQGIRQFFERIASDGRVDGTAVQTVGTKGYDGLFIATVR